MACRTPRLLFKNAQVVSRTVLSGCEAGEMRINIAINARNRRSDNRAVNSLASRLTTSASCGINKRSIYLVQISISVSFDLPHATIYKGEGEGQRRTDNFLPDFDLAISTTVGNSITPPMISKSSVFGPWP